MNTKRAEEIVKSLGYVDVVHENKSVWIEKINEENQMVLIEDMNSDEIDEVPISELVESNKE